MIKKKTSKSKKTATKKQKVKVTQQPEPIEAEAGGEEWFDESYEGQLSVDVYQDKKNIIVKSTIAGVKPEDLDIFINDDMLTIRGVRKTEEEVADEDYFYRECYWGGFSRSIILPIDIRADKISATLKNGVLTIILPKAQKSRTIPVKVKESR